MERNIQFIKEYKKNNRINTINTLKERLNYNDKGKGVNLFKDVCLSKWHSFDLSFDVAAPLAPYIFSEERCRYFK